MRVIGSHAISTRSSSRCRPAVVLVVAVIVAAFSTVGAGRSRSSSSRAAALAPLRFLVERVLR